MTVMFLDTILVILLLFGIKAVKEFYDKYKEFLNLKDDLNCVMRQVQISMRTAQTTIETLQNTIKLASEHVEPYLPMAATLKEDLAFLSDRGEKIAEQLESLSNEAKNNYKRFHNVVFDPEIHDQIVQKPHPTPEPVAENSQHIPPSSPLNISHMEKPTPQKSAEEHKSEYDKYIERRGFFTTIRKVS